MNSFLTFLSCLIGFCPAPDANDLSAQSPDAAVIYVGPTSDLNLERTMSTPFDQTSVAGNYLAGEFAQHQHDWERASKYMGRVRLATPDDLRLMSKSMILYMGSGQTEAAVALAHEVVKVKEDDTLAHLFLAAQAFHEKNYEQASKYIEKMPDGSLSDFMMPLLRSWAKAGVGEYDTEGLDKNTIHIYHDVLIADFLNEKGRIATLLEKSMTAHGMTLEDIERVADVYAYIGKKELALELYTKAYEEWSDSTTIPKKIAALQKNENIAGFLSVKTPEQGIAKAMHEMALLLYREYSDDSARIFAHMALFLDPELTNTKMLLAHISSRNKRYDEAIAHYRSVDPESDEKLEARRLVAGLLEDTDRIDESLEELELIFKEHNDLDSLIQIGDIYRRNEEFGKAIDTYNRAEKSLGTISKEYWHLYYVRGMSYEQDGQWQKAESDLEAALTFQPNHPLVLNYLGYAWADQGVNLTQSLDLIRKAAELQSSDGYIIDSLGWVLYRTGQYNEAVPELERAVELLPYDPVINDHLGDAYWQVGRRLEARFQWLRARNHSDDIDLSEAIAKKLESGLKTVDLVKEAHSDQNTDIVSH